MRRQTSSSPSVAGGPYTCRKAQAPTQSFQSGGGFCSGKTSAAAQAGFLLSRCWRLQWVVVALRMPLLSSSVELSFLFNSISLTVTAALTLPVCVCDVKPTLTPYVAKQTAHVPHLSCCLAVAWMRTVATPQHGCRSSLRLFSTELSRYS